MLEYGRLGLFKPKLFDQYSDFVWSKRSFTYKAGSDFGEVLRNADNEAKASGNNPAVLTLGFVDFVEQLGLMFTKETSFDGRVQLNKAPQDNSINLYIIDRDPQRTSNNFRNNCEYVGYYNAIICDAGLFQFYFSFIDSISTTYDVVMLDSRTRKNIPVTGDTLKNVQKLMKESILIWVLGHEIGHAILHKDIVLKTRTRMHFDLEYSDYEKQADQFVADKLVKDRPLASNFWVTTGEFIHQEYRRLYREQAVGDVSKLGGIDDRDFVINNPITISYSRYTVPLLLRAVRVINRLVGLDPEIDGTGYYQRISDNITSQNVSPTRNSLLWTLAAMFFLSCVIVLIFWTNVKRTQ